MRKVLPYPVLIIFLLVGSVFSVYAQEKQGPKFFLKEQEVDLGDVKEGEIIEHTFTVRNQGDETLEIVRVKPG